VFIAKNISRYTTKDTVLCTFIWTTFQYGEYLKKFKEKYFMIKLGLLQQYLPVYKYVQSELYVLKQRKQCLSKVNVIQYRVHVHTF
jgi:hypothetical protein